MMEGWASIERRTFLRLSAAFAASVVAACSRASSAVANAEEESGPRKLSTGKRALLVYFSRAGENYFDGGRKVLAVGNTAVVARIIHDALGCDVFQIRAVDRYPDAYEPTVQRNVREQSEKARPEIIDLPESIAAYDTILVGSPIWNVRLPRIMLTFAERFDFTGKLVHPFTTHAMSGLGKALEEYTAACHGAALGEALAVRGEEVEHCRPSVIAWLRRIHMIPSAKTGVPSTSSR